MRVYYDAKYNMIFQVSISVSNSEDSEDNPSGPNEVILDDLRVVPGECPNENSCNFEFGTTCSYESIGDEDWIVADAESQITYGGPSSDHTTESRDGKISLLK